MAGAPLITFFGNLTGDPELRFTPQGKAVASFSVACNDRKYNSATQQWEDGETTFLRCSVWEQLAENVAESLEKGMRVLVSGTLQVRQYDTKEGGTGTSVECRVEEVGPSLRWATARVTKTGGQSGGRQQSSQSSAPRSRSARAADPWSTGGNDDAPPF